MKKVLFVLAFIATSASAQVNFGNTAQWANTLNGQPQQAQPMQFQPRQAPRPQMKPWFQAPEPIQPQSVPQQIQYNQVGDHIYGSDGSHTTRIGNTIYHTPGNR